MKETRCIGIMTGTSLDGIDIIDVTFKHSNDSYSFKINHAKCFDYETSIKTKLANATSISKQELENLDIEYGAYLGETVNLFLNEFSLDKQDFSFIASHGYTVFHQPEKGFTLQIGSGQELANTTQINVICDFRTKDVEKGGQGAPLVPIGDHYLFHQYDACVNLGGFGNITLLNQEEIIAFDICPVNLPLNKLARLKNLDYDSNGAIGKSFELNKGLLNKLNSIEYYTKEPPKSLGTEWLESDFYPALSNEISEITTLYYHISHQIADVLNKFKVANVIFTGGGAFNNYLIELIKSNTSTIVEQVSPEIIEFKEALIFGFLGLRYQENKYNCLASVTGAKTNVKGGRFFEPKN